MVGPYKHHFQKFSSKSAAYRPPPVYQYKCLLNKIQSRNVLEMPRTVRAVGRGSRGIPRESAETEQQSVAVKKVNMNLIDLEDDKCWASPRFMKLMLACSGVLKTFLKFF